MADAESAVRMKSLGRLLFKLGLGFVVLGAFSIFLGVLLAGLGSRGAWSPGHLAVLAGVAVALNLGIFPVVVGGILWVSGRVREARIANPTPNRTS